LSLKNNTRARWDAGWTVFATNPDGRVSLQKGEFQRIAVPGEYAAESGAPGVAPGIGSQVSVQVRREAFDVQPGLYFAYSETLSDVWDDYALLRFYFHITPNQALDLLQYLTNVLNRFQVPFRLKAPTTPSGYWRTDAVVLYVAQRYYAITERVIASLPDPVRQGLRPQVPLFTKPIIPGIGFAEEPNTGESFGMHRCRLTAEAIVDAWQQGLRTVEETIHAVGVRFMLNGLALAQPYLSISKSDIYT
jgi:hypothetical protein